MGKGGGGGQQPTQNTTTSYTASLQPELMPYAQDIAQKSQTLATANYTPYQGQEIGPNMGQVNPAQPAPAGTVK